MSRFFLFGGFGSAILLVLAPLLGVLPSAASGVTADGAVLRRFASAAEFDRYLAELRRRQPLRTFDVGEEAVADMAPPMMQAEAPGIEATASPAAPGNPEITNNQTVGVDEGGIVKQIGRFLVILQDGRLFSADLGAAAGDGLRLADRIDVYRSPATAASWYDEMLVEGNRILVTAYNYREQASEITVIRMDEAGDLAREGRFLLSSNDYYSTENYATRLVGDQLVFYAPQPLLAFGEAFRWPRLRRADGDGEAGEGDALIGPTDVYAPPHEIEWPILHTVSICPLRETLDCRTTAFIGPPMREFYVSPTDAFLWIGAGNDRPWAIDYGNQERQNCPVGQIKTEGGAQSALVYRIPLDGAAIGAVAADGIPADQFAFDSRDGRFRALLARHPLGCFKADAAPLALLDLPLSAFGSRIGQAADSAYAPLPPIAAGQLENRFVGRWLIYGGRTSWSGLDEGRRDAAAPATSSLYAVPLARPADAARLDLPHNALRIERAGNDALVTGYRDSAGLRLSYVSLAGSRPRVAGTTLLADRFESEGRSHAFNAWVRADGGGLIGLPTTLARDRSGRGWSDSESSELSFIAIAPDKALAPAGELAPRAAGPSSSYRCEVSCVDWYGNSRPIFTGGRIFALMGTDLVEGMMTEGRIRERTRLDLTGETSGRAAIAARKATWLSKMGSAQALDGEGAARAELEIAFDVAAV